MAKLTIKLNGAEILTGNDAEKTRESIAAVMGTQNPGAKSIKTAMDFLGGNAYVESLANNGDSTDVIEVYENDTLTAKGTRKNIAAKMTVALSQDEWYVETFTSKTEKAPAVPQKALTF